ncbi:hypothetical protein M404DRAFT_996229, partial [Pisolithus tinctorius Marx 270]
MADLGRGASTNTYTPKRAFHTKSCYALLAWSYFGMFHVHEKIRRQNRMIESEHTAFQLTTGFPRMN